MAKIRRIHSCFNDAPLFTWAALQSLKVANPAASKLARLTGLPLVVARTVADLHGLGPKEGR